MKQAVLLLAHGAPERLEDVEPYLMRVRGGRPLAPHLVEEIRRRYAAIGGGSPLTGRTLAQARALEQRLSADGWQVPAHVGMRNWDPSIRQALASIQASGAERIVALRLTPQCSGLSGGIYVRQTEEAKAELGYGAQIVWTGSLHDHPQLIEAFSEKLAPLVPCEKVLFTAHSLPSRALEDSDAYDREARDTARAVALRAGLTSYDFAYQSQGFTDERWLEPTVETVIDRYAGEGVREVVLAPIGFVCDHLEILYDVDILFRKYAHARGIRLRRPDSLNDSPAFIAALAGAAEEKLQEV